MTAALPSRLVAAGGLLPHVSWTAYRGSPLNYGRDGSKRHDSRTKAYGVLYLAFELPPALMESVFHKHRWHQQRRRAIALAEV